MLMAEAVARRLRDGVSIVSFKDGRTLMKKGVGSPAFWLDWMLSVVSPKNHISSKVGGLGSGLNPSIEELFLPPSLFEMAVGGAPLGTFQSLSVLLSHWIWKIMVGWFALNGDTDAWASFGKEQLQRVVGAVQSLLATVLLGPTNVKTPVGMAG
jgi:hypothetical protein